MNQAEEFFSDLKEWSARKLSIIKKYVDGFSKILGRSSKLIYYVDGFAGRGIYENSEKGSPVLVAEASLAFQQGNMPFTLNCINIEKDHDNFINLSAETKRFGFLVSNFEGSFDDNIDDTLSQIVGCPAVFFIDDFGIKGTGWESVEKVVARKDSTDIWIRFDYKTVRRLAGFYTSDAKDAHGKLNTLKNLFGVTDSKYLEARLNGATSEERIDNAICLYIEQIERTFSKFGKKGFAASYPIVSIDGQRKYHLIFACAHLKAATLASNVVNSIEETFQHEKEEHIVDLTGQMSFFTSEVTEKQIFDDKVKKLKEAVLLLHKNKPLSREELHYEIMIQDKSWFGKIGRKHLTQALKELLNETSPKIRCIGTPGNDDAVFTILE
ncbi:MAG TPA: three-Cys-motif partner protein TcmP [Bacteroidales bacterium]|nr:three-Cys-motif partner protein TcmP [Bacteroidales bacterium]